MFDWKKYYLEKINTELKEKMGYTNVMQIPKIEKVVINAGVGDATKDAKLIESMFDEITSITGQKPVMTKSKKAIATYKLRENQDIGVKVTLRGQKMWNFIANLINVAMPRIRDFKGIKSNSFDSNGNYSLGIKEQIIFTEVSFDKIKKIRGFDVTFVMSSNNKDASFAVLKTIGLPFRGK